MSKDEVSKEELEALQKDIEKAATSLSAKERDEVQKSAREEGKKEAEKEFQLQKQLEEAEKKRQELEQKLEKTQQSAAEELKKIQERVDEMAASKQVVPQPEDPFKKSDEVDKWSDDKIREIEEKSAVAFFGADYETMMSQR